MRTKYNVGDKVRYDGIIYKVEQDYGDGVYFIGNDDSFVDLVPACCLTPAYTPIVVWVLSIKTGVAGVYDTLEQAKQENDQICGHGKISRQILYPTMPHLA